MKFADPRLLLFRDEICHLAQTFRLNTDRLLVESYIPNNHAIVVESVGSHRIRLHINLQENRIISIKELGAKEIDMKLFQKYLEFMR